MPPQDFDHDLYKKILLGIQEKRDNENTSEFSVPNFFTDNEWSVVPHPSRKQLGKRFKQKVDANEIKNVVFCYTQKTWAVYKMIF